MCPISHDILIDPVTAQDGHQYERCYMYEHIEHVQKSNQVLRSPKTNLRMGNVLLDAISTRNILDARTAKTNPRDRKRLSGAVYTSRTLKLAYHT